MRRLPKPPLSIIKKRARRKLSQRVRARAERQRYNAEFVRRRTTGIAR